MPLLHNSDEVLDLPDFATSIPSAPVHPMDGYSLFAATASRNVEGNPPRQLPEFYYRKSTVMCFSDFRLGDELVTLEFIVRIDPEDTPPLPRGALTYVGHQNGTKDQDDQSYWAELRTFFKSGQFPARLVTEKDMLRFRKRSQRFFLQDERLWLAPKKNSGRLPRLVIENLKKRMDLMAAAHNECGHRGRDATYRHLADRFYWPNMYDQVTYFVRSCIECQKSVKSTPILPYNESWQAPLLRHFNLDSIKMPNGVGGVDRIIQATEPTILWPEARAISGSTAAPVAKFIYEDIICCFGCVPYFTFDGGPEFQKEVTHLLETQYRCTVIFSTPYHPQGNAPVERAHQPLVDSLFKCSGDAKGTWPRFLYAVLFAMRVTVSRATGFSPYYLLYGAHPIFSFDITEITWQTLDWHMVHTHEELIALRALQLSRRDPKFREANERLRETRRRAIEDMAKRVGFQWDFSDYEVGMYVWLRESHIDEIKGGKGLWTYSGPYIIHEKREHDSFVLKELSGAILPGHVNIRRLRLFYYRPTHQTLRAKLPQNRQQLSSVNYNIPTFRLDRAMEHLTEFFRSYPVRFQNDYS